MGAAARHDQEREARPGFLVVDADVCVFIKRHSRLSF
jgi:hypothetical protein